MGRVGNGADNIRYPPEKEGGWGGRGTGHITLSILRKHVGGGGGWGTEHITLSILQKKRGDGDGGERGTLH